MGRFSASMVALLILVGCAALAAALILMAPSPQERVLPPQLPLAITGEIVAGQGSIPVRAGGSVRPVTEIALAPQVSGKVVWVSEDFHSGAILSEGELLFRIEDEDYAQAVTDAEAEVATRSLALLETEQQALIAKAQLERYAEAEERTELLHDAAPLALWEPQLEAARAALKRDEANLAKAKRDLARTRINAPFNCYARDVSVGLGQVLADGGAVASLFVIDAVEVLVPLSGADAALIPGLWDRRDADQRRSIDAEVTSQYGEGRYAWPGYVHRAEAALDTETRTINVVIRVNDPFTAGRLVAGTAAAGGSPPLMVGEYVDVVIQGVSNRAFFRLPRAALNADNEVWLVDDQGVVSIRKVEVLQRASDEVLVLGALADGQRVVTGGLHFATEGMRVQVGENSPSR